jgi:hypothetical protein
MNKSITNAAAAVMMATVTLTMFSCSKEEMNQPGATTSGTNNPGAKIINSKVFPSQATMFGKSYSQWSASWWQYMLEFPPVANHPFNDDQSFDVSARQSGKVWFLAAPFANVTRNVTIPSDKALFVGLLNSEASDLEGLGATYTDRVATAIWQTDHAVLNSIFCTIDGRAVTDFSSYRVVSPEFSFNAPSPWIYGTSGGPGVSVADGYYLMLKPMPNGNHTIHYGGSFHFSIAEGDPFDFDGSLEMTYNIITI